MEQEFPYANILIIDLPPGALKQEHHKIRFIIAIQEHLKLLKQYERLDMDKDSPLSKAILQATDYLRQAAEIIDELPKDKLFDNIYAAFEPVAASLKQAIEIAPLLNKITEDPEAQAVYENGTQLAGTLLERANSNFMFVLNDAKNIFAKTQGAGWSVKSDNTPVDEMKSLKGILDSVANNAKSTAMSPELQNKIDAHKKRVGSTASLYWDKFVESISDYMGKKIGTRLSTQTKATYFDEKISSNKFVGSISAFYKKKQEKKGKKEARKDIELDVLKNSQRRNRP